MTEKVVNDLRNVVIPDSKPSITAANFSLYAFETSWTFANKSIFNLSKINMSEIYESFVRFVGAANANADRFFAISNDTKQPKDSQKDYIIQSKQRQKSRPKSKKWRKNSPTKSSSIAMWK